MCIRPASASRRPTRLMQATCPPCANTPPFRTDKARKSSPKSPTQAAAKPRLTRILTDSKPTVTATRPRCSPARGRGWTFIRRRRGEQRQVGHQYPTCKLKQQGSLKPKIRFSGCLWRLVLRQSVFVSQKRANRFSDSLKLPKIKRLRTLWRCSTPICKTAADPAR